MSPRIAHLTRNGRHEVLIVNVGYSDVAIYVDMHRIFAANGAVPEDGPDRVEEIATNLARALSTRPQVVDFDIPDQNWTWDQVDNMLADNANPLPRRAM